MFLGQTIAFADFNGDPFRSWHVNESLHSRHVILYIQTELFKLGWTMMCTGDFTSKCHRSDDSDFAVDCHTWFMIKQPEGTPIYSAKKSYASDQPPSYFNTLNLL